jgi:hypothetical protein
VRLIPTLGFENELQRDPPNVTHLRAWTVQRHIDADAAILKIVFETFTIDFHLSKAHHCFKRNAIVSAFDLATVGVPLREADLDVTSRGIGVDAPFGAADFDVPPGRLRREVPGDADGLTRGLPASFDVEQPQVVPQSFGPLLGEGLRGIDDIAGVTGANAANRQQNGQE